jgi:hypothetical protein
MTGYRFFFPFRDMPTLIWIKEKEGIFCTGKASSPPIGRHRSGCQKFNDDESDFAACREAAQCRHP